MNTNNTATLEPTPAPARKRTPKAARSPLVPTGRASPVVRVCARRPCGKERFYLLDESQSALIVTVQGYPTLTLDKVEALQALGVRFQEVEDPEA
jgi:hypothetical protein